MNWGRSIVVVFVLFAILIISMVVISMRQDVNLVAVNYYEEEIAYQDQIDRQQNFKSLVEKPSIEIAEKVIVLSFPASLVDQMDEGIIHFFRPSDQSVDRKIKIQLNEQNQQVFSTADFTKGLWMAKLTWKANDKEYFTEERIVL